MASQDRCSGRFLYCLKGGKEGEFMSDFEMLSIVLMILDIVVTILIAYIDDIKK